MLRSKGLATALVGLIGLASATVGANAASGHSTPARSVRAATPNVDDLVHLNQIQVVGSHNSYHRVATPAEIALRKKFIGVADTQLEYDHVPLLQQFTEQKVRQIELDVWRDDAGGKYANPLIRSATGGGAYDPVMNQPGLKVFHVQDVDYHSSCLTLKICLQQVKSWSDANPRHLPLAILIEQEDAPVPFGGFPFVVPDPWTVDTANQLDSTIHSVFSASDLITPDDVRGSHATLNEAVTTDGWPTLAQSRGKVLFIQNNNGSYRDDYLNGHPGLQGRVMFTNANPGDADAGFVMVNDAKGNTAQIQQLVKQGYVVRTRSDADTLEAQANDTSERDAAFASGAQWVSTDFPVPEYAKTRYGNNYVVQLPGQLIARCNPVNAPQGCVNESLELQPLPPPPPPTTTTTTTTTTSTLPPSTEPKTQITTATPATPIVANPRFTG